MLPDKHTGLCDVQLEERRTRGRRPPSQEASSSEERRPFPEQMQATRDRRTALGVYDPQHPGVSDAIKRWNNNICSRVRLYLTSVMAPAYSDAGRVTFNFMGRPGEIGSSETPPA